MPEAGVFCQGLVSLLDAAHDAVQARDDQWKTVFCDIANGFLKMLRHKPLLERLAGVETTTYAFRELFMKMDGVVVGVDLGGLATQWSQEWEAGRAFQARTLRELVTASSSRVLIGEMKGVQEVKKAMVDMYTAQGADAEGDLAALKRETLERLRVFLGLEAQVITSETVTAIDRHPANILSVFEWYIAERNVKIIGEPIGAGSCGIVSRAEWRDRNGLIQNVIVKTLYEKEAGKEKQFLKQLQFWYDLPKHPNIVELYGGSHLARDPFFVCEDAHGGNIVDFLGKDENRGLFWNLFRDVARGLKELHDHSIVHDGLKGNNILMGEDNQPKISDLDCSHIRALSASFSQKTEEDKANAVRWKAREKLVEAGNELSLFKSDVYSLGMTMIEALTQAPPFGMELEEEILNLVVGGEAYEKPEEASESEWRVISQLIAVRIEDRPSTDEAIELISTLITEQTAPGG
jgi:hypothetical protein